MKTHIFTPGQVKLYCGRPFVGLKAVTHEEARLSAPSIEVRYCRTCRNGQKAYIVDQRRQVVTRNIQGRQSRWV